MATGSATISMVTTRDEPLSVAARRADAGSDVLQAPEREQQDNYDQYDAKGAAWSVAPAARVWPGRQCTDQSENQDYQQYGSKAHQTLLEVGQPTEPARACAAGQFAGVQRTFCRRRPWRGYVRSRTEARAL